MRCCELATKDVAYSVDRASRTLASWPRWLGGSAEEERAPFDDDLDDTLAFIAGQHEYDQAETERIHAEMVKESEAHPIVVGFK